jgi:hypothetical protein
MGQINYTGLLVAAAKKKRGVSLASGACAWMGLGFRWFAPGPGHFSVAQAIFLWWGAPFFTPQKNQKNPRPKSAGGAFWPLGRRRKGRAGFGLAEHARADSGIRSFPAPESRHLAKAAWAAAKRAIGTRNGEQLT